jgi:ElaB/YqjD/DUF883 family membrane-anchored ribosome-binding protein
MLSPDSTIAAIKDRDLPAAVDRLQSLAHALDRRLRPAALEAGALVAGVAGRFRRPTPLRRIGNAASRVALFARANPLLTVGLVAGAGFLIGLASLGASLRANPQKLDLEENEGSDVVQAVLPL